MNFWIITVGEDNPGRLLIIGSHDENLNGLLHVLARACLIRGKGDVSPVETEGKRVGDSRIWRLHQNLTPHEYVRREAF